jgi:serine/threonine protein kinase
MERDIPIYQFHQVKVLKQSPETVVSVVVHKQTNKEYVLKAYSRTEVTKTEMAQRVLAERDILRLVSGIEVDSIFDSLKPKEAQKTKFPRCLNKLATTTKDEDWLYLVLERAKGIDLVEFIKLLQPRLKWDADSDVFVFTADLEEFLKVIAVQVLIGLEALNDAGIIYKDLKASHVFIDAEGKVTMIDFGLSEQTKDNRTEIAAGTLHAMSPEMLTLY